MGMQSAHVCEDRGWLSVRNIGVKFVNDVTSYIGGICCRICRDAIWRNWHLCVRRWRMIVCMLSASQECFHIFLLCPNFMNLTKFRSLFASDASSSNSIGFHVLWQDGGRACWLAFLCGSSDRAYILYCRMCDFGGCWGESNEVCNVNCRGTPHLQRRSGRGSKWIVKCEVIFTRDDLLPSSIVYCVELCYSNPGLWTLHPMTMRSKSIFVHILYVYGCCLLGWMVLLCNSQPVSQYQ